MGEAQRQIIASQGKEIRALKKEIRELKNWKEWVKQEKKERKR